VFSSISAVEGRRDPKFHGKKKERVDNAERRFSSAQEGKKCGEGGGWWFTLTTWGKNAEEGGGGLQENTWQGSGLTVFFVKEKG